ncbi:MAG TPA: type II toxin-antitoxin system RelE/ParE family toxin [Acidobacteriaceae bacterium]|nr:type II toxin-antitoxin system RelE/ParE family toxin [Acidobacteriaceae bacterium]
MRVNFSPAAEDDLAGIQDYLVARFSQRNANRFVQRILRECHSMGLAPRRGTARDDVGPGIRIVGFQRRVSIVFKVNGDEVIVLGVYYGGREFDV